MNNKSTQRKGLILAGGRGTRLYPLTIATSKHMLPVYDKPMIYYPLSILMRAGIRDILIISTPEDLPSYYSLLGDGHQFGIALSYAKQPSPDGLAQAFIIGESFIGDHASCLILGDNFFYGSHLAAQLQAATQRSEGATLFACQVPDPERFGVISFDPFGQATSIEEKPMYPKSPYAVTGLYFYDKQVTAIAKQIKPSARGELEITDINRFYLNQGTLHVQLLEQETSWLDMGTHDSLLTAGHLVQHLENQQKTKIACLEEIAFHAGWITLDELIHRANQLKATRYGHYLLQQSPINEVNAH